MSPERQSLHRISNDFTVLATITEFASSFRYWELMLASRRPKNFQELLDERCQLSTPSLNGVFNAGVVNSTWQSVMSKRVGKQPGIEAHPDGTDINNRSLGGFDSMLFDLAVYVTLTSRFLTDPPGVNRQWTKVSRSEVQVNFKASG